MTAEGVCFEGAGGGVQQRLFYHFFVWGGGLMAMETLTVNGGVNGRGKGGANGGRQEGE